MDVNSLELIANEVRKTFKVYSVETVEEGGETYLRLYVIDPDLKALNLLSEKAEEYGIELDLKKSLGEEYIEVRKKKPEKSRIWLNVLLLILTFATTTWVGMSFYPPGQNRLVGGIVFSAAILFVLGSHEMGHYFAARKWGIKTSLPYFIPAPTILGTFGAVITQKSPLPLLAGQECFLRA